MKRLCLILLTFTLLISNASAQDVVSDLLGRVNNLRASVGVAPYTLNSTLTAAAQNHANWLVETGQYTHTQSDGSTPITRARALGYPSQWVSENYYMGQLASVDSSMQFWINSPPHYRGMTAAHYTEIGIASARANGRTAFVLVFGNPSNARPVIPSSANSPSTNNSGGGTTGTTNNSAVAPPSFILGQDEWGNILHEVQPGQSLGDIILLYGYDWSYLNDIRNLNSMTEAQGRLINISDVIKIPPYDGTWTPAPGTPTVTPFMTATLTPIPGTATPTPSPTDSAPYEFPTLTPMIIGMDTETPEPTHTPQPSHTPLATETIIPTMTEDATSVAWSMATFTPESENFPTLEPTLTPFPMIDETIITPPSAPSSNSSSPPPWVFGAIGAQVMILVWASWVYARRKKTG
jgi:hypothetical protein